MSEPAPSEEIERKFLVADSVRRDGAALDAIVGRATRTSHLRQAYLAVDDHDAGPVELRVRERDDEWILGVKGGRGLRRTELELTIDPASGAALWPLGGERSIEKVRHFVPLGERTAEVDVYGGRFDGLVTVEVEFPDDASAERFVPPSWFGLEVTDDDRWANANLARYGRPDAGVS